LEHNTRTYRHTQDIRLPILIKQKIKEKGRLRRGWHRLQTPESKRSLNTATQELEQLLNKNKNDCIQTFLQGLTPTESTDYSLWKATKKIKQPLRTSQGSWARSNAEKAHTFAEHLAKDFQPHPSENEPEEEEALTQLLETPYQLKPPINHLNRAEVQEVINSLNTKKSSGYDFITGKILKELPIIGIKYLTRFFNAVLLKGYFQAQWKVTDHPHFEARKS
jgi:hypothetical protein